MTRRAFRHRVIGGPVTRTGSDAAVASRLRLPLKDMSLKTPGAGANSESV
jgi:hypothetical protein